MREQLSTTDSQANGRILDLKTGTVKKEGSQSAMRLCMGSRRGFICRLKVGNTSYHTQMPSPWSTPDIGDVVAGSDSLHRYAVARVDSRYRDAVAGSTPDIGMPSPVDSRYRDAVARVDSRYWDAVAGSTPCIRVRSLGRLPKF